MWYWTGDFIKTCAIKGRTINIYTGICIVTVECRNAPDSYRKEASMSLGVCKFHSMGKYENYSRRILGLANNTWKSNTDQKNLRIWALFTQWKSQIRYLREALILILILILFLLTLTDFITRTYNDVRKVSRKSYIISTTESLHHEYSISWTFKEFKIKRLL